MTKKPPERIKRKHLSAQQIKDARAEYCANPESSHLYLADKYDVSLANMSNILANKTHYDPDYINPHKCAGNKKITWIPAHINEMKDNLTPPPTTLHRARGHNRVIDKFS
jgi:hypothetical protein